MTLRERVSYTVCPRHGAGCDAVGMRGLLVTYRCGYYWHTDSESLRAQLAQASREEG